ncbi:MAG: tetratricopeptide repeat protein, partial [Candidatus Tenebribacter mawsonii]|nr:tetratricopeptide repeat protein [Candidatus Tenebribacter mawsonii]
NNHEQALYYYLESMDIESEIGNKDGIAGSLNNIGMVYENLSDYNKALEYFRRAEAVYKEIGNKYGQALTLDNIGSIFRDLTNYDKSIEYHLRALKIHEEIDDKTGIAKNLGNIGMIYDNIGEREKALDYYHRSLKMEEELGNQLGIAGILNNIGIIYDDMRQYDIAIEYYKNSHDIYKEISNLNGVADASNNIGVAYKNQKKYEMALQFLQESLDSYNIIGRKKGIAVALNNIATVYKETEKYSQALEYFNNALIIAKDIKVRDLQIEIYENISDIYAIKKNYKTSLQYYKLYSSIKDSTFTKERMEIISGMETTYEVEFLLEEQEKEIVLLQKDNEIYKLRSEKQNLALLLLVFGLVILMVIGFVFFYRYILSKKTEAKLEKEVEERTRDLKKANIKLTKEIQERKELQNQLMRSERLAGVGELAAGIAHEIRNPLGNISSSAQICLSKFEHPKEVQQFLEIIQEDSDKANSIIKGLLDFANPRDVKFKKGSLLKVLKNVIKRIDARCQEKNIIVSLTSKESIRESLIDAKWLEQAFLNITVNAINAMPNGGELKIVVKQLTHKIKISCIDNGHGISKKNLTKIFDPFFTTREDGVGLGLSLTHQIFEDHKGSIQIESKEKIGTKVLVEIPIQT